MRETITNLRQQLHEDVGRIHVADNNSAARHAGARLTEVAEHSPPFIALLAEPWLGEAMTARRAQLLRDCARIHLYARVLDDAIDENLAVCRHNLLRAQPLFWTAVQSIGASVSAPVAAEATWLIEETVGAVLADDLRPDPGYWASKNHHLLLIPLLLSGDSPAYRACRPGLSSVIALVQAGDEWQQGVLQSDRLRASLLEVVTDSLDHAQLETLQQHGWHGVAERIAWNAQQLIDVLSV